jgi:hypothetical protein
MINAKLQNLYNIKNDIGTAIVNKGGTITESTPFYSYAGEIDNISTGTPQTVFQDSTGAKWARTNVVNLTNVSNNVTSDFNWWQPANNTTSDSIMTVGTVGDNISGNIRIVPVNQVNTLQYKNLVVTDTSNVSYKGYDGYDSVTNPTPSANTQFNRWIQVSDSLTGVINSAIMTNLGVYNGVNTVYDPNKLEVTYSTYQTTNSNWSYQDRLYTDNSFVYALMMKVSTSNLVNGRSGAVAKIDINNGQTVSYVNYSQFNPSEYPSQLFASNSGNVVFRWTRFVVLNAQTNFWTVKSTWSYVNNTTFSNIRGWDISPTSNEWDETTTLFLSNNFLYITFVNSFINNYNWGNRMRTRAYNLASGSLQASQGPPSYYKSDSVASDGTYFYGILYQNYSQENGIFRKTWEGNFTQVATTTNIANNIGTLGVNQGILYAMHPDRTIKAYNSTTFNYIGTTTNINTSFSNMVFGNNFIYILSNYYGNGQKIVKINQSTLAVDAVAAFNTTGSIAAGFTGTGNNLLTTSYNAPATRVERVELEGYIRDYQTIYTINKIKEE